MPVPRQLTVDRSYHLPSFAAAWLALLVFFYASLSDLRLFGFLSPRTRSVSLRRPLPLPTLTFSTTRATPPRRAVDIASIESDVEDAHCPGIFGETGISHRPSPAPRLRVGFASSGRAPR